MTKAISDRFSRLVGQVVKQHIVEALKTQDIASIMFTGGRTAEAVYRNWSQELPFDPTKVIHFFGDERFVPEDSHESNYGMLMKSLYSECATSDRYRIERIRGESTNQVDEVDRYAELLPDRLDLILLTVGEDGHIASLFPYYCYLESKKKMLFISDAKKLPRQRATITSNVIKNANNVIVMAAGSEKGHVLAMPLKDPGRIDKIPVRMTIGKTWILDENAAVAFQSYHQQDNTTQILLASRV